MREGHGSHRMSRLRKFAVSSLCAPVMLGPLAAQGSTTQLGECAACTRVTLRLDATLDTDRVDGLVGGLVRLASGQLVAAMANQGVLSLFDSSGHYVRDIARKGAGPGEVKAPWGIRIDRNGNLRVVDIGLWRQTAFDQQGDVLWSAPLPAGVVAPKFYPLADSGMIVSTLVHTADNIGYSFHRTRNDRILSSFGPDEPIAPPNHEDIIWYVVASATHGGFLALQAAHDLRLEWRNDSGSMLRTWTGHLDWLDQPREEFSDAPGGPGAPQFVDLGSAA